MHRSLMRRVGLLLLTLVVTGCGPSVEVDPASGVPIVRVTVDRDAETGHLRLRVNGEAVETETDQWPPDVSLPDNPESGQSTGTAIAFHAPDDVSFAKLQPLLKQLATHSQTFRFVLLEKSDTPASDWHWSRDIDLVVPVQTVDSGDDLQLPGIRVRLRVHQESEVHVYLGSRNLGPAPEAWGKLNADILQLIGRPGDPIAKDIAVELEVQVSGPDRDEVPIQWRDVRRALLACSGRRDKTQPIRYLERFEIRGVNRPEFIQYGDAAPDSAELLFEVQESDATDPGRPPQDP